jgi:hypothetical protein
LLDGRGAVWRYGTMADRRSSTESARAILQYFARHHLLDDDKTERWTLEQEFFQENPSSRRDDFEAGLSCAIEMQWLRQDGDWFILTGAGFEQLPGF